MSAIATTDIRAGWTSASNAAADLACPGRHNAQRGLVKPPSNDADTGQRIHAALKAGKNDGLTLDEAETADACREIEAGLVERCFPGKTPNVFREERFWCEFADSNGRHYKHSAQVDCLYRLGTQALILDYKALFGDVPESPKNLQLRDEVCLVCSNQLMVNQAAVAIVQPRITRKPDLVVYQPEHIERARVEMFTRIIASNQDNAPRIAGNLQCAFCLAKGACKEYAAWAGSMLPAPRELFEVAMAEWSPEQRALAAGALVPAVKMLEQIKDFLKEGLTKDPEFIPGWCLREGNRRSEIKDAQKCFERFIALGGKSGDFMTAVKVGKTKLKEAVNAATGLKGKKLETAIAELCEGIVEESRNAPSLERKGDA